MEDEPVQETGVEGYEEKPAAGRVRMRRYQQLVERRTKALHLRTEGKTYEAIAKELGISLSQAHNDVSRALLPQIEREREAVQELRQMEGRRLDLAVEAIMPQLRQGNLSAVDRLVQVSARRAKLMGLDKRVPVKDMDNDGRPMTIRVEYVNAEDADL